MPTRAIKAWMMSDESVGNPPHPATDSREQLSTRSFRGEIFHIFHFSFVFHQLCIEWRFGEGLNWGQIYNILQTFVCQHRKAADWMKTKKKMWNIQPPRSDFNPNRFELFIMIRFICDVFSYAKNHSLCQNSPITFHNPSNEAFTGFHSIVGRRFFCKQQQSLQTLWEKISNNVRVKQSTEGKVFHCFLLGQIYIPVKQKFRVLNIEHGGCRWRKIYELFEAIKTHNIISTTLLTTRRMAFTMSTESSTSKNLIPTTDGKVAWATLKWARKELIKFLSTSTPTHNFNFNLNQNLVIESCCAHIHDMSEVKTWSESESKSKSRSLSTHRSTRTTMTNDDTVGVSTRCKILCNIFHIPSIRRVPSSSSVMLSRWNEAIGEREDGKNEEEILNSPNEREMRREDLAAWLYFLRAFFSLLSVFSYSNVDVRSFRFCCFACCLTFSRFNHRRCGLFIVHLFFCFAPLSNFFCVFRKRLGDDDQSITIVCLSEMTGRLRSEGRWAHDEYEIEIEIDCLSNGRRQQKAEKSDSALITFHRYGNWWFFRLSREISRVSHSTHICPYLRSKILIPSWPRHTVSFPKFSNISFLEKRLLLVFLSSATTIKR